MTTSPDPQPSADNEGKQSVLTPTNIFYSYAKADEKLLSQLRTHLNAALGKEMNIQEFYREKFIPGKNEDLVVKKYLKQAQLILLLISADFFGEHLDSVEMKEILDFLTQPRKANTPYIIPILVEHALLPKNTNKYPFAALKSLPSNQKPIAAWNNRNEAFANIVAGIRKVIEDPDNESIFKPFSLLPKINPFFTGRKAWLRQLRNTLTKKLTELSQPLALFGLGGVGKTQLAIAYAHLYREWYTNVFLLKADTRETLIKDYARVAVRLNLVKRDEADQILIVERMMNWLKTRENWLLILDNVHDRAIVQEFIPDEAKGHILLTTQKTAWGGVAGTLEIKEMSTGEGTMLLLRRAKIPFDQSGKTANTNDQNVATEIVEQLLGRLPLAIDQAGAYIEATGCGLPGYAQLYQKLRKTLLATRGEIISQTYDHRDSVVTTFLLAFDKVEQVNPIAADLLRLCAFLAPDAIPQTLITEHLARLPYFSDRAAQPDTLEEASRALRRYSLIHRDTSSNTPTLTIHRLVQAVLQDEMDKREQRTWAIRAVNLVSSAFPRDIDFQTWPDCQMLLPHVLVCASLIDKFNLTISHASRLLDDSGYYLFQRGLYREARPLYEQALTIRQSSLGPRDALVAQSLHHLGELNRQLGSYTEAEQQLKQALGIREQTLGVETAYTASSLNSLAEVYRTRGKYDQAKQLYKRALDIYEQAAKNRQSAEHPSILNDLATLYNNLATLHQKQKEYDRADELYRKALSMSMAKGAWGEEHPITAQILHDQAELYKKQGKLEEAERLHLHSLDIRKRVEKKQRKPTETGQLHLKALDTQKLVEEESRDIAMSLNSLGALYMRQGNRQKAEDFYIKALEMRKKVLGLENPETAESMYELARLYRNWNRAQEAEDNYRQALKIREKRPGLGDFSTLQNQKALADFYQSQGRGKEAEVLYEEALASRYEQLRFDDPTIAFNLDYLAKLYEIHDEPTKIERLYKDAFGKYAARFGLDDPLTQRYWQKMVEFCKKGPDKDGKLEWLYVQVFDLRARYLRGDNINTIKDFVQSVKDLAELYNNQNQKKKLKELYYLAVLICHQQLGGDHYVTLRYQDALMTTSGNSRAPSNSRKPQRPVEPSKPGDQPHLVTVSLLQTADMPSISLEIQEQEEQQLEQKHLELQKAYEQSGVDDPATVELRHELAQLYEQHEKPEEAERIYRQALFICALELGSEHAATIECRNDLARCFWSHGRYDEAKPLIHNALALCEPVLEKTDLTKEYILACVHALDNAAFLYLRELDTRQLKMRQRYWLGGEPTKAEKLLQQALAICVKEMGEKHSATIGIREHYIDLLQNMGLHDEAEIVKIRVTTMQKRADKKESANGNLEESG